MRETRRARRPSPHATVRCGTTASAAAVCWITGKTPSPTQDRSTGPTQALCETQSRWLITAAQGRPLEMNCGSRHCGIRSGHLMWVKPKTLQWRLPLQRSSGWERQKETEQKQRRQVPVARRPTPSLKPKYKNELKIKLRMSQNSGGYIHKSLQVSNKQNTKKCSRKIARLEATCKGTALIAVVVVVAHFGVSGSFAQGECFLPLLGTVSFT